MTPGNWDLPQGRAAANLRFAVQRVVGRRKWEIELYSGEYYHTFTLTSSRKPKTTEPHKVKFGDAEIDFDHMDICGIKAVRRKRKRKPVAKPSNGGTQRGRDADAPIATEARTRPSLK